jgi:hypothetical protein
LHDDVTVEVELRIGDPRRAEGVDDRSNFRKRCSISLRKSASGTGVAVVITPTIVIGLPGRSIRNQAVSTADMRLRRVSVIACPPVPPAFPWCADYRQGGRPPPR